jgi:hypothetical protein
MQQKKRGRAVRRDLPGYSLADVLVLTDATKSNMQHWTKMGVIRPEVETGEGKGHHRRFSPFNIIEVQLAAVVNKTQVPVSTIYGALSAFRAFHRSMRAVYEQVTKAPIVTEPQHLKYFDSERERKNAANSYVYNYAFNFSEKGTLPERLPEGEMSRYVERAKEMASAWAELRTGSIVRGIPNALNHTFWLFLSGIGGGEGAFAATITLGMPDQWLLSSPVIGIEIEQDVVWQVGQRCKQHHHNLGAW